MAQNLKHVVVDGYKLDVDLDNFDDVRFFEATEQINEHPALIIDILKMGIGEETYKKMADHFTKRDGKFKMSIASDAVDKILGITDPKEEASGPSESSTQTN